MQTYLVPRKADNQNRILYFFTMKGFLYLAVGMGIGFSISLLLRIFGINNLVVTLIIVAIPGLIGLIIGEAKIPDTKSTALFRYVGGEKIDDIIIRWFKFRNAKKVYIYGRPEQRKE